MVIRDVIPTKNIRINIPREKGILKTKHAKPNEKKNTNEYFIKDWKSITDSGLLLYVYNPLIPKTDSQEMVSNRRTRR
jgi:hypothetical protein